MSNGESGESESPAEGMRRAVADLWSQSIATGDDYLVFHDHFGNPARLRHEDGRYFIAWVVDGDGEARWDEDENSFDNPRQAALHAFQGPEKGRT